MKRKTISLMAALVMLAGTAFGQIIYTDEDYGTHLRSGSSNPGIGVMVPLQNSNLDQWKYEYVPLGDGLLLLAGLGGAYLLGKRKKTTK